uniref:Uncharacterized protein n=1 Tax=Salmo trutta TaxID=8032 RepID=A0A673Y1K2_SALTR
MDLVLNVADRCLHPLRIPVTMARGKISLLLVTNLGAVIIVGPQNQVLREIKYAMTSLPIVSIPTVVFFLEASSDNVEESPMGKTTLRLLTMISFLLFTDGCIYWIHRFLHHKRIYKVRIIKNHICVQTPAFIILCFLYFCSYLYVPSQTIAKVHVLPQTPHLPRSLYCTVYGYYFLYQHCYSILDPKSSSKTGGT